MNSPTEANQFVVDPARLLYKIPPMEHQLEALRRMKGKRGFMLSMEQGTGKTFVDINETAQLWGEGKINGLLVFAPNGVHSNWVEVELPKTMPDWVQWRARAWNSEAGKAEAADFETIMAGVDSTELRIACFNWEALAAQRSLNEIKRFINSVTRLKMTADESQDIANPGAKRTKTLDKIKMAAAIRRTLTGTPILNAPFDLFSQYGFLDPSILRTTSFFAFKAEYADMMPATHPMIVNIAKKTKGGRIPQIPERGADGQPRYRNLDKLSRLIEPYTFRVLKKDCLDLPDKVYTQSFFEMAPAQRTAYKKMEKEFRYTLSDGEATAVSKLTALGKLTQISSGFINTKEDGIQRLVTVDDSPKLQLLKGRLHESIEQLGNQVIIWLHYIEELNQVVELLKKQCWSHATYYGATKKEERTEAIRAFQAGEISVLVVQIQTGSTGITLTAAKHVIYYSNTFSYGDRSQSEDRAHRIGQVNKVLYEDLLGKGTRDMAIVRALRNKKNLADLVNGDARELLED